MAYAELLSRLARIRALGVDLGLDRMRDALARLGDPQKRFAAVQIAGTNGKGSTAAMTEAILRASGLRTGLYTSPHLSRFTERIRIDGREIDGEWLGLLDRRVEATGVALTYFEVATALGFLAMASDGVEVAVLETGLGGRLDAVTTAVPIATAVTSIGLDHTAYLGETLAAIAGEKAGIIKAGIPCFVGALPAEADAVIAAVAAARGAPLLRLGRDFEPPTSRLSLGGPHQRANAALAVALAKAVAEHRGTALDDATTTRALAQVSWPGRLERVEDDLLFDCAHNEEGARALATAVAELAPGRRIVLLASIVRDKDPVTIFAALAPVVCAAVATRSTNTRALPTQTLAETAKRFFPEVATHDDPEAALAMARRLAGPGGLVLICGSTFLVGALRAKVLGETMDPEPTSDPV